MLLLRSTCYTASLRAKALNHLLNRPVSPYDPLRKYTRAMIKKKGKNTRTEECAAFLESLLDILVPRRHGNSKRCSSRGGGKVNRWSILFDLCGAGTRGGGGGGGTKCFRSLHSQAMVEVTRPSTPLFTDSYLSPGKMCATWTRSRHDARVSRVGELHYLLRISNFRYWTPPTLFTPLPRKLLLPPFATTVLFQTDPRCDSGQLSPYVAFIGLARTR